MSGFQRPRYGPNTRGRMTLPRVAFAPVAAQVNSAFATIELADQQNIKEGQEPQFPSVLLTDANRVTWRITVSTTGVLQAVRVPLPNVPEPPI